MIIYTQEQHFKAHSEQHPHDHYDNIRRDVICLGCGTTLGTQIFFPDFPKCGWEYENGSGKNDWKFCPHCGNPLEEKKH